MNQNGIVQIAKVCTEELNVKLLRKAIEMAWYMETEPRVILRFIYLQHLLSHHYLHTTCFSNTYSKLHVTFNDKSLLY